MEKKTGLCRLLGPDALLGLGLVRDLLLPRVQRGPPRAGGAPELCQVRDCSFFFFKAVDRSPPLPHLARASFLPDLANSHTRNPNAHHPPTHANPNQPHLLLPLLRKISPSTGPSPWTPGPRSSSPRCAPEAATRTSMPGWPSAASTSKTSRSRRSTTRRPRSTTGTRCGRWRRGGAGGARARRRCGRRRPGSPGPPPGSCAGGARRRAEPPRAGCRTGPRRRTSRPR